MPLPSPALPADVTLAFFQQLLPNNQRGERVDVLFNPASLQYTASNTLKEEGSGSRKKQFVDKSSAKLTMTLMFDTTDTGVDVREKTQKVLGLLKPLAQGSKQVPANVEFNWGAYKFTGLVEQYKETLDFFSPQGTPLRASIDITLASQDIQFESARNPRASVDGNIGAAEPALVPNPPGSGPAGAANSLGDPRAARAIAAANGASSLRFGEQAQLAIGAGIDLRAEAAFSAGASASASFGAGIGASAGAGAGFSVGGGAGFSAGASAGFSAGGGAGFSAGGGAGFSAGGGAGFSGAGFSAEFGGGASGTGLNVSASASAVASGGFAGLRTSTSVATTPMPDARASWTASSSSAIGSNARFEVGGKVVASSGGSLNAEVGAEADINALIRFG